MPTAGWLLPGEQGPFIAPFAMDWSDLPGSLRALGEWMMALGKPLGVGLLALGLDAGADRLLRGAARLARAGSSPPGVRAPGAATGGA